MDVFEKLCFCLERIFFDALCSSVSPKTEKELDVPRCFGAMFVLYSKFCTCSKTCMCAPVPLSTALRFV